LIRPTALHAAPAHGPLHLETLFWSALLERYLGRARAELAEDAATAAWEEGRRTRFEHAIALALDARER
jgi:hypothetical protein